ncbi:heterodisulfide reductase-related iron-sulfur binding cluster [Janibacter sp. GXQ6167]|uniref:heterodisulfide reductase-related iron-sulfur binding cluster n=1 Tax=Janibacter sp. GXQ6167 TaxID=3240791 RepID=UPI0035247226
MSALVPANLVLTSDMPWWPKPNTELFGEPTALQWIALTLCFIIPLIGWALLARQVSRFVKLYRLGRSESRTDQPAKRTWTLLREFFGHTRMSRLPVVSVAHWFTALSFLILFTTLVNAFFQLVRPDFRLPIIGHFPPFEWLIETFAWAGFIGIIVLIIVRQKAHPRNSAGIDGRRSRFFGSNWWQAYYVEFTIFAVCLCIVTLRTLEAAMVAKIEPDVSIALHFPLTGWAKGLWMGMSLETIAQVVYFVAMVKILISFAWMITISLQPTMGVAWHRFLAFPNIWFKRNADGRTALGALEPMMVGDKPFSMEAMEEMDEDATLGVGKVEDFTWKGLLDFSTCTECGRCQSQCPAWNTDKPLSPKLLIMTLRNHANAKAPYLRALKDTDGDVEKAMAQVAIHPKTSEEDADAAINWSELSLIGQTGYDVDHPLTAYSSVGPDAVIDEDVLWSCTTCGACVEQCPVDIEHVDHIVDMRRYQNLIESAFPSELGGLFKNIESKGNPWGMGAKARMDWAKDLPFDVKVLGEDVESAKDVDYLFWVGCAGAYEDRAKKTTRAVAELFDMAGVNFAVLGNGETCTGDSARRAGNEVLFQMLAEQNVETLNAMDATKIVVTCAHCFNTIKNEYPQLGGNYEVLHHTQLLNRLVRDKKLTPVTRPNRPQKSSLKNVASTASSVTYHDPCYLGRHNHVYAPPRELIGALPGVELKEMERTGEKSFCCGAGGARMWMEEQLGSRINVNRTDEAIATGAERIAVGCPFCRVMLTDGLTARQSEGASEDIEVVDIAQMLLASVKEAPAEEEVEEAAPAATPAAAPAAPAVAAAQQSAAAEPKGEAPTAADANAAPSWEADASTANAAPSWEDEAPAAANAAPSWETDTASANAAPSWESDPAPAVAAAQEKAAESPSAADANAAPSWETDTASANAAPSWEDESPAAANAAPSWETDAASANAAPSWEDAAPAAPAKDDAPAPAEDSPAAANAAPAWETDAATANAAPSWETEAPAAPASDDEVSEPKPEDGVTEQQEVTGSGTPTEGEITATEPAADAPSVADTTAAPADDSLAAQNAAPSWETEVAAANAAPSWETEAPAAPAAPAAEQPAAEQPAADDEVSEPKPEEGVTDQQEVTGSGTPTEGEITATEPAADAPSVADTDEPEPAPSASADGDVDLDELRRLNSNPSWE